MKTIQFIWRGPEIHLGRFGNVTPGTLLPLTEKDAKDVKNDPRFERLEKSFERPVFKPTPSKPGETEAQKLVRLKADREREAVCEQMNQEFERNENAKEK